MYREKLYFGTGQARCGIDRDTLKTCLCDPIQVGRHGAHKHLLVAKLLILNATVDTVFFVRELTVRRSR